MAITRRQFVTRLGALAAAAGFSQVEASKIMEAVAFNDATSPGTVYQGTFGKPRVVWIHGAECTGCSTSLLGIYENVAGEAIEGTGISTATALTLGGELPIVNPIQTLLGAPGTATTLHAASLSPDPAGSIDIADVVIDVIDLLYHETVQGMAGDLAYQWLADFAAANTKKFILVVEGALQKTSNTGAWGDPAAGVPWCSVAKNDAGTADIVPAEFVQTVGEMASCVAIVAIGQCATFGGYPGCKPQMSSGKTGFDSSRSQTDAMGVYDYLTSQTSSAAAKVVNAPGCPTNPWWFILTVVALTVEINSVLSLGHNTLGILNNSLAIVGGVDSTRRLGFVYGRTVHGTNCTRFHLYTQGIFASNPGEAGCLQSLGCKGPSAHSLCSTHGWNNQQPQNDGMAGQSAAEQALTTAQKNSGGGAVGTSCTRAGHPCMACTEKGYPDNFVPFVTRH